MPVYVYKNLATGETFEVEQRITEDAYTAHPESGDPVKRLVQPVGIAFKGSGFYVTDSRGAKSSRGGNGAAHASESKDGAAKSEKADAGSTSGDAASATKTEGKKSEASKSSD
ncbi:MAG: FmdB family zinc ribbon protein [Trueperaceae bacterium]|nr:FmdB family zinc ribbon protein [Trueperaceae bacterium]